MSATSPVVSPRKGKHTRSKGFTLSSPIDGATTRFSGSQSALPANVDPLTLDPDDAFVRFSVREIQTIETSLQSTHDQLSSNLRSLVSEKYRDMLGTANTLIEMSSSATNLVNRLDAVRQGIDKARAQREGHGEVSAVDEGYPDDAYPEDRRRSGVYAIAAATKLLAESPDDVYRAVDSASLDGATSIPAGRALLGRQLNDFKAATTLRAAWIYILCQKAWKWLSEENHEVALDRDIDFESLFPYISKQWSILASMKTSIINVAHIGLQGWYPTMGNSKKRWEDVSSSYMSTVTFLLTSAFLEGSSIIECRDLLLSQRRKAIQERLRLGTRSPSTTLTRLVRSMAETMIHCLRSFVIRENGSGVPHLATIFASTSSHSTQAEQIEFPPSALQALSTLPSASIFVECLPVSVRHFTPRLEYEDAEECMQSTVKVMQDWSMSIRQAGQEGPFARLVDRLSTISSIGEAQIQLRENLDRCYDMVAKVCSDKDEDLRIVVEQELKALVAALESLLLRRLDVICQERTAELPAAVSDSISSALTLLSSSTNAAPRSVTLDIALEKDPTKFLFDPELTSSSLETRLRLQTPLVKRVLFAVEQHAQSLGEEMAAYAAYVQRDARKRAKRKHRPNKQGINGSLSNGEEVQMDRVLHSYRSAFDSARIALTDELSKSLEPITSPSDGEQDKKVQLLYIIRIASAFQHSTVLQSSSSMAGEGSNDLFLQRLQELRRDVINQWVKEVVEDAIALYSTKVKVCLDPRSDQLGRPTAAFSDCLMQIVDGLQAVGCGYQSEVSALGQQLLIAFTTSWLNLEAGLDEQGLRCYTFDSHALSLLLSDQQGSEKDTIKLVKICSSLEDEEKEQIERALYRLRLILIPLRPLEAPTQSEKRATADRVTSAPPLPMLTIIQGRDRVPLLL